MKPENEDLASIIRTDRAMWRLAVVLFVCTILAYFADFPTVMLVGLLLGFWALFPWFRDEFKAWDRGGPAGEIERAEGDSTSNA